MVIILCFAILITVGKQWVTDKCRLGGTMELTDCKQIGQLALEVLKRRNHMLDIDKLEALFRDHGCIERTIKQAHTVLDLLDVDPKLKFQAKMGTMKEISVSLGAISKPESRKSFILNIANELTDSHQRGKGHLKTTRVRFLTLLFHAKSLNLISLKESHNILKRCVSSKANTYPVTKAEKMTPFRLTGGMQLHSTLLTYSKR